MLNPKFEELFEAALDAREEVATHMRGRMADDRPSAAVVAAMSAMAGAGNHVEIGVLWGGSLLTTALLRRREDLSGKVIGIDPLDGYYMHGPDGYAFPNSRMPVPIDEATVWGNVERFNLTDAIELVASVSNPWPKKLARRRFVSAFLDANHWGGGFEDFENVSKRHAEWVAIDNYPEGISDGIDTVKETVDRIVESFNYHLEAVLFGVALLHADGSPAEDTEDDDDD